jgi:hypothetical protein
MVDWGVMGIRSESVVPYDWVCVVCASLHIVKYSAFSKFSSIFRCIGK